VPRKLLWARAFAAAGSYVSPVVLVLVLVLALLGIEALYRDPRSPG
jgi:hypothetical protein